MSCLNDPRDKKSIFMDGKRQKRILKPQHKKANATKQHHKLYLFISLPTCLSLSLTTPPFYSYHNNNSNNGIHFSMGGFHKG